MRVRFHRANERPLAAVPRAVKLVLVVALSLQIAGWATRSRSPARRRSATRRRTGWLRRAAWASRSRSPSSSCSYLRRSTTSPE